MRRIAVVVGSVLVVAAGLALADEEWEREELIEDIDEKVEDMGDEISGFESDSDAGDLDDALSYARDVKDQHQQTGDHLRDVHIDSEERDG